MFQIFWSYWLFLAQILPMGSVGIVASTSTITFINGACAGNANIAVVSGVNMTGANFFIMSIATAATYTVVDSSVNSYTAPIAFAGGLNFSYAQNATATGSMSFTVTTTGGAPGVCVFGFSGMKSSSSYEGVSAAFNTCCSVTNIQAGPVTPTQTHNLIMGALQWNVTSTNTVDSGFSSPVCVAAGVSGNFGNCMSYLIQTGTAASNAKWSLTNTGSSVYAGTLVFQGN